jgi:hypothetical protein
VETLTFKQDGTYQQAYSDTSGYAYTGPWNEWWLETRASDCRYVHLGAMRYFVTGAQNAEEIANGVTTLLIEPCENRVIETGTELALAIVYAPLSTTEIRLMHLKPDGDNGESFFLRAPE